MKAKFKNFPWDYILVIITLAIANVVTEYLANEDLRILSFRYRETTIENLPPAQEIDLLVLGDSRSKELKESYLASKLGLRPEAAFNASTISGSWVTSYSLLRKTTPHLTSNTQVLLCVSEFWLEKANYQQSAGLVPAWKDYLLLNEPKLGIASLLPLSRKRDRIVNKVRRGIADSRIWLGAMLQKGNQSKQELVGTNERNGNEIKFPTKSNDPEKQPERILIRANVDSWFTPISQEELQENLIFAGDALEKIREKAPNLTLVYLPNARSRESYVDENYPDRKKRFLHNVATLARKLDLPFIDMSGEIESTKDALFSDFHHWNETGAKIGTEKLADRLAPSSPE